MTIDGVVNVIPKRKLTPCPQPLGSEPHKTCGCHLGACRPRKRVTVQSCWNIGYSVENMNMGVIGMECGR